MPNSSNQAIVMIDDGPWDHPTAEALMRMPVSEPIPPQLADRIRASAAIAKRLGRRPEIHEA